MDRARSPDACMAPVLARLVRSLAMLSLAAGVAIVVHSCVWATLCFTEVRAHGLTAVTHPDRALESSPSATNGAAGTEPGPAAVAIKNPTAANDREGTAALEPSTAAADEAPTGADRFLAFVTGAATLVGVSSLALLPIVLIVAFITALVRAPRAANASMAGILWATFGFGAVLPWGSLWPQVPWNGLFISYAGLVAETEALRAAGNPFTFSAFLVHVAVPGAVIVVLVGLAWRCGEPLHAELMAAESLSVDPEVDRDAAATARKGPTGARSRSAAGLAVATTAGESSHGHPLGLPAVGATSELSAATMSAAGDDERPRRLI